MWPGCSSLLLVGASHCASVTPHRIPSQQCFPTAKHLRQAAQSVAAGAALACPCAPIHREVAAAPSLLLSWPEGSQAGGITAPAAVPPGSTLSCCSPP